MDLFHFVFTVWKTFLSLLDLTVNQWTHFYCSIIRLFTVNITTGLQKLELAECNIKISMRLKQECIALSRLHTKIPSRKTSPTNHWKYKLGTQEHLNTNRTICLSCNTNYLWAPGNPHHFCVGNMRVNYIIWESSQRIHYMERNMNWCWHTDVCCCCLLLDDFI